MHAIHRLAILGLLCSLSLFSHAQPSSEKVRDQFNEKLADASLIERAKQGGLVIYMRHGATNTDIPDQVPIDLNNCTTQRPLTEAGLAEVRQIGHWVRQIGLPYAKVYDSPLCRAKQTALAAFGEPIQVDLNLQYVAALTTEEKKPIIARTLELLAKPTQPGTNRIIVAHGPNLVETMMYFPPEGTLVFIEPLGQDGFRYLGSIPPSYWPDLLKTLGH
jgi:phosphohistidine phosphatase SixA